MATDPHIRRGALRCTLVVLAFAALVVPSGAGADPNERLALPPALPHRSVSLPILMYHRINVVTPSTPAASRGLTVHPADFERQMLWLKRRGYRTVTQREVFDALFRDRPLGPRPILITFDDGQLDSYRYADPILKRFGFRATMFVITDPVDRGNPFYLRWDEIRQLRDSGRWDLQLHAGAMHKMVAIDAKGTRGAAYANRQYVGGRLESFAAYQRRVSADLELGMRRLREELGPVRADAFAYPFSADGSWQTNDKRIPAFLDRTLHARFSEVFDDGHPLKPPRTAQRTLERKEVNTDTTAEALYDWLAIDPRTPAEAKAQAAAARRR